VEVGSKGGGAGGALGREGRARETQYEILGVSFTDPLQGTGVPWGQETRRLSLFDEHRKLRFPVNEVALEAGRTRRPITGLTFDHLFDDDGAALEQVKAFRIGADEEGLHKRRAFGKASRIF